MGKLHSGVSHLWRSSGSLVLVAVFVVNMGLAKLGSKARIRRFPARRLVSRGLVFNVDSWDGILVLMPWHESLVRGYVESRFAQGVNAIGYVNVGAHIGACAVGYARYFSCVLAIEPTRRTFEVLRENIRLNRLDAKISALCGCAGEVNGTLSFYVSPKESQNSLSKFSGALEVRVPVVRLDDAVRSSALERVDFLQIDVEGAELSVLRGADTLLRDFAPTIVIELLNSDSVKEVSELLSTYGYVRRQLDSTNWAFECVRRPARELPRGADDGGLP